MRSVPTHYDHLKVVRNAPPEVIRAAYQTLCRKYHPDLNPGNPDAAKLMSQINVSYDVLSCPKKRAAHDQWIAEQEVSLQRAKPTSQKPSRKEAFFQRPARTARRTPPSQAWVQHGIPAFIEQVAAKNMRMGSVMRHIWEHRFVYIAIALAVLVSVFAFTSWSESTMDPRLERFQISVEPVAEQSLTASQAGQP